MCINDDLKEKSEEMSNAIHSFYESFFPKPSQFEKPQTSHHLDWRPILSSVLSNYYLQLGEGACHVLRNVPVPVFDEVGMEKGIEE